MTQTNKDTAKTQIDSISSGGSTSIGAGLTESRDTFTSEGVPKSIILLSDGHENSSPYYDDIKDSLEHNSINVFTVGLGNGADKDLLRRIANENNGKFFFADNEEKLPGIFAGLYGTIRGDGLAQAVSGTANEISTKSGLSVKTVGSDERHTICPSIWRHSEEKEPGGALSIKDVSSTETVLVDTGVIEVTFLITWDKGNGTVSLSDPSGNIFTRSNFESYSDVSYVENSKSVFYRINGPTSGEWLVSLDFDEKNVQWELRTFIIDANITFSANSGKGIYTFPELVKIHASCGAPQPVIGGMAEIVVVRPEGSEVSIKLWDDGDQSNGDDFANDGIYSNYFRSFSENGVYTVTASFDSTDGTTPVPSMSEGIEFDVGDPSDPLVTPETLESFQRFDQFTFTLAGAPPETEDTDGDGMLDIWEVANSLDMNDPADASKDPDSDTLSNLGEFENDTDPHEEDTDGDNYRDGIEVSQGTDPLDPSDYPIPAEPVPTVSEWGMMILSLLICGLALVFIRKTRVHC